MRKTVSIAYLIENHASMTNALLRSTSEEDGLTARLETLNVVLESLLHANGVYAGFQQAHPTNRAAHHYLVSHRLTR